MGRHGGGPFSGKDPTKVDRSAAYMARHIAKNVVAGGLAERCEVQLAYAIGVADPVSVLVETFGTETVNPEIIPDLIRSHFKLTPRGIIESLNLRRPIYKKTAAYGHFGRSDPDFTWELTDKAAKLASDAGFAGACGCSSQIGFENPLLAKDARNGAPGVFNKVASQTRDSGVAKNATHRAARPDPSAGKSSRLRMTSKL